MQSVAQLNIFLHLMQVILLIYLINILVFAIFYKYIAGYIFMAITTL